MVLQHPIFQTPFSVDPTFVETPTPENYRNYPEGVKLPKTLKTWKVQHREFPTIDVGVVSSPSGFDEPDSEVISSGLNSKGPNSVALARHGNFFMWGFHAQPADLTDEARKVFVNAVSYIHRFDGQRPIASRMNMSRSDLGQYFVWARNNPSVLQRTFGAELVTQFKGDVDGLEEYVTENLAYMRTISRMEVRVDVDAQAVGIANNNIALLERAIALLDHADAQQGALGQRLLERYTDRTFDAPAQWSQWLKDNRDRMFFSDVGGFRWYVMPE